MFCYIIKIFKLTNTYKKVYNFNLNLAQYLAKDAKVIFIMLSKQQYYIKKCIYLNYIYLIPPYCCK